jgi:hypothetical protein
MWGYDRLIVPLSRLIQRIVKDPPVGKNVILIATKGRSDPPEEMGPRAMG